MRESDSLPEGWCWVTLGELLTSIETGKSFKCDERPPKLDEVGVIKVSAVTWGEYQEQESKTCMDPDRVNPALFVQPGDFLFSRANTIELVGACVIARQVSLKAMLSDKILRFCFAAEFMKLWVLHFLRSKAGRQQIETLSSGNQESMRNIGQERIGQIRLPFPPAAEQTRIVAKLDELLSGLDAGVAELKAAQRKLQRYRQSLLKAAVDGALTADWRRLHPPTETGADLLTRILRERRSRWEAQQLARYTAQNKPPPKGWKDKYPEPTAPNTTDLPPLPEGWVWATCEMLGDLVSGVAKGSKQSPTIKLREVPYLRVANVQRGYLDLGEIKTIEASETDIAELSLKKGDVLFNEGGDRDKLGRGWVWEGQIEGCIHQNHVFRLRPFLPEMRSGLISHHGNTFGKRWFQNAGKQTTNLASINLGVLKSFPVPIAPPCEQAEILRILGEQLESIDRQAQVFDTLLKQSAAQRQNLLRAAFRGELVPQDPTDEPASAVLARLRAEWAAAAKPTRSARKPGSAA